MLLFICYANQETKTLLPINKVLCDLTAELTGFQLSLEDSLTGDMTVDGQSVSLPCVFLY